MQLGQVLVSATRREGDGAVVLLDLDAGTCSTVLPYRAGGIHATADALGATALLPDLETGPPVHTGLTMPHDRYRLDDGWLVTDSGNCRTLFFPDAGGEPRVVAQLTDFTRGLAVLPEVYVIGFSIH